MDEDLLEYDFSSGNELMDKDLSDMSADNFHSTSEKSLFDAVFDVIHEGVVVIERNLKISYANYAAKQILGLDNHCVGQRISRVLHQVNWEKHLNPLESLSSSMVRYETELFYPHHCYISYYIVFLPQTKGHSESGNGAFAAVILQDITESLKATERSVEAEKMHALTLLTAGVAHELGNPLNSLGINLQILERVARRIEDAELKDEVNECLDVVQQEVHRLDGIIHHFLRAVRPVPLQVKPISIVKILEEVLAFMKQEIENKCIRWQLKNDITGLPIKGDADQLKQAFFNLIKNAIQAMQDGGELVVACYEKDNFVHISFKDNGAGIPIPLLSRITDPYYSTKSNGTGLGLVIVERIIRAHGGTMSIESREGSGTEFILSIPLDGYRSHLLC